MTGDATDGLHLVYEADDGEMGRLTARAGASGFQGACTHWIYRPILEDFARDLDRYLAATTASSARFTSEAVPADGSRPRPADLAVAIASRVTGGPLVRVEMSTPGWPGAADTGQRAILTFGTDDEAVRRFLGALRAALPDGGEAWLPATSS